MKSLLVSIFIFGFALAQEITVLATRGEVKVNKGENWEIVKTGQKASSSSRVLLGPNSYLAAMYNGQPFEVKRQGVFTFEQLRNDVNNHPYVTRYTGYVLNQAVASGAGRASGRTLGAVTRNSLAPRVLTPKSSAFYRDSILLSWERVPGSEGYIVQILGDRGDTIGNFLLDAHVSYLKIQASNMAYNQCYYYRISTKKFPSLQTESRCFMILDDSTAYSIKTEEEDLKQSIDTASALGQAILGAFYERHGLFMYAFEAYDKAAKLEPGVETYIKLRDEMEYRIAEKNYKE